MSTLRIASRRRFVHATLLLTFVGASVAAVPGIVDHARAPAPAQDAASQDGSRLVSNTRPATAVRPTPPPPGPRVLDLRDRIDRIVTSNRWSDARWGVLVVSLDRGDTLYSRNPREAMAPASNMKMITSAAALHHLGPDFRFRTWALADGPISEGVLEGNLVLYGTGDPTLSDRYHRTELGPFREIAERLRASGVEAVAGDLIGDGTYFSGPLIAPSWDPADLTEWFAAPVSALSFNENMISLRIEAAGWVGAPPRVQTLPIGASVLVQNEARTVAGPPSRYSRIGVVRQSHTEPIQVLGEIQLGSPEVWREMTVSNPPLYAVTMFQRALEEEGIEVYGRTRGLQSDDESPLASRTVWGPGLGGPTPPRIVAEYTSPPLTEILEVVNNESHNLFAEAVFRSVGAAGQGDASFAGSSNAVTDFLVDVVGAPRPGLQIMDGSGLSAANRVTASAFVRLVTFMAGSDQWASFRETLPEAGNRRELPRMFGSAAAGNLRAKTGTIGGVSALSGVVQSAAGERLAFSIIANEVRSSSGAKNIENRIGVELAEFDRPMPRQAADSLSLGDSKP